MVYVSQSCVAPKTGSNETSRKRRFDHDASIRQGMPPEINRANGITGSEAISLLHLLHSVSAPPSRDLLTDHVGRAQGYNLCFSDEVMWVEILAFLLNIEHNVNRIPAVCIHQHTPQQTNMNQILD
jgi:hypothetical protein